MCPGHVDDANVLESGVLKPLGSMPELLAGARHFACGRSDLRVAGLHVRVPADQRFQHEFSAVAQRVPELPQMRMRFSLVIQDAHRKRGVKRREFRAVRESQRQDVNGANAGHFPERSKLADEKQCRVDADHRRRAGSAHAASVVTVAAANIQNRSPVQRSNCCREAIPFQVETPLRIDVDALNPEWSLAPGRRPSEVFVIHPIHGCQVRPGDVDCQRVRIDAIRSASGRRQ